MADLSKVQGRHSRSARSHGFNLPSQQTSIAPVAPVARNTAGANAGTAQKANNLASIANTLGKFYPAISNIREQEHQEQLAQIQDENTQLAKQAENTAHQRPQELRKALETGDWSAFPELTPDTRKRVAFLNSGRKTIGSIEGAKIARDPEFLAGLHSANDPDQFRADFLRNEVEGADGVYAQALTNKLMSSTEPVIARMQLERTSQQAELQLDRVMTDFGESFQAGDIKTADDLSDWRGEARRAGEILGPTAAAEAEERLETEIIRQAIEDGDPRAMALAELKDPESHDGLSMIERRKELAVKFEARALEAVGTVRDAEQKQELLNIEIQGRNNPQQALRSLLAHEEQWSPTKSSITLYNKLKSQIGSEVNSLAIMDNLMEGNLIFDKSDVNKVDTKLFRQWFPYATEKGLSLDQAANRLAQWTSSYGASSDLKNLVGRQLNSDEPATRDFTLAYLNSLGPRSNQVLAGNDALLWDLIQGGADADIPASEVISKWNSRERPTYEQSETMSVRGLKGADLTKQVEATVEAAIGYAEQAGRDMDTDFFGSPEESHEIQAAIMDRATHIGYLYPDLDNETVFDMAARSVGRDLDTVYIGGENKTTISSAPNNAKRIDAAGMDEIVEYLSDNASTLGLDAPSTSSSQTLQVDENGRVIGTSGGEASGNTTSLTPEIISYDPLSAQDGMLGLQFNLSGIPQSYLLPAGEVIPIPADRKDTAMFKNFPLVEGDAPEGQVLVEVPSADVEPSERLGWTYDKEDGMLYLRMQADGFNAKAAAERVDSRANSPIDEFDTSYAVRDPLKERAKHYRDLAIETAPEGVDLNELAIVFATEQPTTMEETEDLVAQGIRKYRESGVALLDPTSPSGRSFQIRTSQLLQRMSSAYPGVYDSGTQRRVIPGKPLKGDRMVGVDFNLERDDADQYLERVGADPAKVRSGKEELNDGQIRRLTMLTIADTSRWLYNKFKPVAGDMREGQWSSLVSVAMSGSWQNGVPQNITPALQATILAKDWNGAAAMIKRAGEGNNLSVKMRREREAGIFAGKPRANG